jgi:hypothetical protein
MSFTLHRRRPRITTPAVRESFAVGLSFIPAVILVLTTAWTAIAAEPFHFPAVLRNGKKVGDLVPGLSALDDVVKMFPAAPQDYPGNPRPPVGFPEVKVGKVQPEPATVYNPPQASYALFFDDNDKLVIIEDGHSPLAGLGPEVVHRRYPKLKGTGHDERVIELQGQIEPCIVMMVLFSAQTRKVTKVAYAFTCPTTGSESTRRDAVPRAFNLWRPRRSAPDGRDPFARRSNARDPVGRMVGQKAAPTRTEQILAQRDAVVTGAHPAAALQLRHHQFDEFGEAAGLIDRHQVDAVDSGLVDPALDLVRDRGGLTDD